MPAKYGKWGTGIENWIPNKNKTVWIHKNNKEMKVFIRLNVFLDQRKKKKYEIYHAEYAGQGKVSFPPSDHANTMKEARKIARKYLTQWNNPWSWV